jgi:hypothetical protein
MFGNPFAYRRESGRDKKGESAVIPDESLVRIEGREATASVRLCTWRQWKAENAEIFSPPELEIIGHCLANGERVPLDGEQFISRVK